MASTGDIYHIDITGVANAPTATGSHSMHLLFYSGATRVYEDFSPWYTIGDGSLETPLGNHIEILAEGLGFPHSLAGGSWSSSLSPADIL